MVQGKLFLLVFYFYFRVFNFMSFLYNICQLAYYVGHEIPGVVAVLCEKLAGPHQLIAAKDSTCSIK